MSWLHWPAPDLDEETEGTGSSLYSFARRLIRLRADHPLFRRRRFFTGEPDHADAGHDGCEPVGDIAWLTPAGAEMTGDDWNAGFAKSVTVFLNGNAITEPDARGERITDDSFLLLFNAAEHDLDFTIPAAGYGEHWTLELDTAEGRPPPEDPVVVKPGESIRLISRSLRLLRRA
jgi:glycogen operon protein